MMTGRIALSSKLPWRPGERDGRVLGDHLDADHDHGLALGGVHLAGHDRGARLVGRQRQLAAARSAGPEASQRMSLAIFISAHRQAAQRRPMAATMASSDALGGELVGRRDERAAGQLGDLRGDLARRSRAAR